MSKRKLDNDQISFENVKKQKTLILKRSRSIDKPLYRGGASDDEEDFNEGPWVLREEYNKKRKGEIQTYFCNTNNKLNYLKIDIKNVPSYIK